MEKEKETIIHIEDLSICFNMSKEKLESLLATTGVKLRKDATGAIDESSVDVLNMDEDQKIIYEQILNYQDKIVSVGDLYLPNKEGIVEWITPLEDLLKMDGVIDGEMFTKIGEYQIKRRVGNDASGWVQVLGENEYETLEKMQKVYNAFEIKILDEVGDKRYVKKV